MKRIVELSEKYTKINSLPGRKKANFSEIEDPLFWELYDKASHYSLLHITGFYNVFQSMRYIGSRKLAGDIVECGCFLGGVGIFMALLRDRLGMGHKTVYLLDSFQGFPPGEKDEIFDKAITGARWADTEQDVRSNISHVFNTDAKDAKIELVHGFVENTLSSFKPTPLCLLRLDTDFYNSTKAELEILYDRLVPGGVLIIDDYGMFRGARRATDEFFAGRVDFPLLNRIDRCVWAGVKPG